MPYSKSLPPKLQIAHPFSLLNYMLSFSVPKTHNLQLMRQLCQVFKVRVSIYPCNVKVHLMMKFYTRSQNSISKQCNIERVFNR